MSGTPPPVVRCLIACEDIAPDETDPRRLSLLRVVNAVRATAFRRSSRSSPCSPF